MSRFYIPDEGPYEPGPCGYCREHGTHHGEDCPTCERDAARWGTWADAIWPQIKPTGEPDND